MYLSTVRLGEFQTPKLGPLSPLQLGTLRKKIIWLPRPLSGRGSAQVSFFIYIIFREEIEAQFFRAQMVPFLYFGLSNFF